MMRMVCTGCRTRGLCDAAVLSGRGKGVLHHSDQRQPAVLAEMDCVPWRVRQPHGVRVLFQLRDLLGGRVRRAQCRRRDVLPRGHLPSPASQCPPLPAPRPVPDPGRLPLFSAAPPTQQHHVHRSSRRHFPSLLPRPVRLRSPRKSTRKVSDPIPMSYCGNTRMILRSYRDDTGNVHG
jgi:hypothetical protein